MCFAFFWGSLVDKFHPSSFNMLPQEKTDATSACKAPVLEHQCPTRRKLLLRRNHLNLSRPEGRWDQLVAALKPSNHSFFTHQKTLVFREWNAWTQGYLLVNWNREEENCRLFWCRFHLSNGHGLAGMVVKLSNDCKGTFSRIFAAELMKFGPYNMESCIFQISNIYTCCMVKIGWNNESRFAASQLAMPQWGSWFPKHPSDPGVTRTVQGHIAYDGRRPASRPENDEFDIQIYIWQQYVINKDWYTKS